MRAPLNTGDTNTGLANSGNVNTGAFIGGNDSNGFWWRGNYQGLVSFSYIPAVLPQTPFLDLTFTGGLGPVVIPAIDVPAIRPEFSANVAIGSFTLPTIPIPRIDLDVTTVSVGVGPISVPHLEIPKVPVTLNYSFGSQPGGPLKIGPITGIFSVFNVPTFVEISQIVIGASSSQGTITAFLANLPFSTPVVTIDEIPLLASVTAHTEPIDIFPGGLTIPAMNPLSINLSGGTGAFTIPAITIPEIPFTLEAHSTLGPIHIKLIDVPAVPGFGNSTSAPSSGFFNSGAGGVSGFGNFGSNMSGWFNQARYEPRRPRHIEKLSQTPNNAAVTAPTSADTPASAIPIYGCSTTRRPRRTSGGIGTTNTVSTSHRAGLANQTQTIPTINVRRAVTLHELSAARARARCRSRGTTGAVYRIRWFALPTWYPVGNDFSMT